MRRLFHGLLAAGLLVSPYAEAAQCSSPADQTVFDLAALKSELMVLATGCKGSDDAYNAFVNRYKPELGANDHALAAYFKRAYGRNAQREQDAYVTNLANSQSQVGIRQGSDFCPRTSAIFREVMTLRDGKDLPAYAAGKDLIPDDLSTCAPAPSPARATVRTASTRSSHGKKH
ncbi:MAG: hypothetical protein J0H14_20275 [Alphaproteobacteria bacterium]|nr:hypothetical protein [Alphaproteobacteria bacterium]